MIPVELILLALSPLFLGFIGWEWYRSRNKVPAIYRWQDSLANAVLALLHQASDMIALILLMPFFLWLYQWRIFTVEMSVFSVIAMFLLQDFLYYWFHRASHHVRWLWASHVTHHSSRQMNFSTALRQSLTYPLSGMWLFWTPMILLGFDPKTVFAVVALNLAFQFFVHTQVVEKLGILEWLFNTPSHHRVHHACNALYIDKNFAGVLIIWDRLFGTFVAEQDAEPCRYGITDDFNSDNPITITFYEWRNMLTEFTTANSNRQRFNVLFGAPKRRETPNPQK
ncbi:sterol desaturase family protein [Rheinheimera maricola]|uniref:Sterol desaturase family protein n=1 Tax=Rheinheimera maricola TaxID=2793282 RepID=A0ABS7X4T8_9GAMM|nr:sterol desaturase family protein [Rheinheimera maricola]MBZ9610175.1 sterol desaturase family protein [Rheinheimera maricola]